MRSLAYTDFLANRNFLVFRYFRRGPNSTGMAIKTHYQRCKFFGLMKKYPSLGNKCVHWPRRIFLVNRNWLVFRNIRRGPNSTGMVVKTRYQRCKFFGLMQKYSSHGNKCVHWPTRIFWLTEIVWFSDISAGAPIQQEWRSKSAISDANSSD